MKNMSTAILLVLLVLGGIVASEALYTVDETQRVIITQFGKPVGAFQLFSFTFSHPSDNQNL